MKLYSLLRTQSSTPTRSFETLWLLSSDAHSKTLKPQLKHLHFPHETDHVICYSYEVRHTAYYVTVRSHTSYSSTNENQVYLRVATEQRRLVVKRTRKILHSPQNCRLRHNFYNTTRFFKHKPAKSPQWANSANMQPGYIHQFSWRQHKKLTCQ